MAYYTVKFNDDKFNVLEVSGMDDMYAPAIVEGFCKRPGPRFFGPVSIIRKLVSQYELDPLSDAGTEFACDLEIDTGSRRWLLKGAREIHYEIAKRETHLFERKIFVVESLDIDLSYHLASK